MTAKPWSPRDPWPGVRFKSIFNPPSPPKPPAPVIQETAPPKPTDPEVENRKRRERQAATRRRGRQQTILTSPLGDTGDSQVQKASLGSG